MVLGPPYFTYACVNIRYGKGLNAFSTETEEKYTNSNDNVTAYRDYY